MENTKTLALKVDVDTYRGTKDGVPQLVRLFQSCGVQATFLFSVGPDHTGRAVTRVFRRGFMRKVSRTSVLSHYGLKTLLYGTLLPGPDIGSSLGDVMRATEAAGFETGIHCWDHVLWQDQVMHADPEWTQREFMRAAERYEEIFGHPAPTHGAAGWQTNATSYRLEQQLGFKYASDTRGRSPFWPVVDGKRIRCLQLPTTLPTLDELLGIGTISPGNVHQHVVMASRQEGEFGHVYTSHAELEGMKLLPVMQRLLEEWNDMGYRFVSLGQLYGLLEYRHLPCHTISTGEIVGRSGMLSVQGARVWNG